MAEDLYEQYAGLFDQQVDLVEQAVVGIVRAVFGDFSSDFKQHLRSLVPPRRCPPVTRGDPPSSQQLTRAEEIEAARDSAQRQIATALANGFGALADLPSALGTPAIQPSISGSSTQATQATADANEANNNADNSDDDSMSIKSEGTSECESDCESHSDDETEIKEEVIEEYPNEMAATAGTLNVNTSDTVSVKTEIESECDSSDSESSDEEEEELTARQLDGQGIKEEIDDANPNDQIMGNSIDESGGMEMMEEGQEENERQTNDNTNPNNSHLEIVHSQVDNSNETNFDQPSDGMMIDDDEASNEKGDDGPTIIVVNYEEFETPSIGSPNNQNIVAEGPSNEESTNIAEPDGEFVETADSNDQLGTLTGTRKRKRSNGRTRKSIVPKRIRVVLAPTVAAELQHQVDDESESEEDDHESAAISFRVIVRRLNCRVPGCKKVFPSKVQLDGHLLTKHAIEKYACKVKECIESYATRGELKTHRNSAHGNLDNEWPCGECETICLNYRQLVTHICYYHEYGLFACSGDKCDYIEKTRIKVHSHQLKHRPAKYRCTYVGCSSAFTKRSNLTTHLRVHSKEKPFLCPQCPKAFAQKSGLADHERVHSGLKPYSCTWPHCDYTASQQSNVILHIRGVHFGLPKSKKKQKEKGIIDNRDSRVFLKKTTIGN